MRPWDQRFTLIKKNAHKLLQRLGMFSELEIQLLPESLMNICNASALIPFIAPSNVY